MRPPIGDEKRVIRRNEQPKWCKAPEGADKFAVLIEDLNAIVFAIADVEISFRIQSHGVRRVEFSFAGSFFSPGEKKLAGFVEFHHPRIAIAVGDKKIPIRRESDVGRFIEMRLILARHAFFAQHEKNFSIWSELRDRVIDHIGRPDIVSRIAAQAVGGFGAFAEGSQEFPGFVEGDDRLLPSMEYENVAAGVDRHARYLGQFYIFGQLRKTGIETV